MSSVQEFDEKQLATARAKAWHHEGDAIVTLEAAREWINERGLVLFAPRAQQLPTPAPTLVEATLGAANAAPTMAQTEMARGLMARMVADGVALPLNLLGIPGDSPDFVVSAQVFSYIFTMRGDKAWKQPPATTGAVKVSPLGLRVYEVLTERGALSAVELAAELGREVTEAAILRSLTELWGQLRVLPLLPQGLGHESKGGTLWEVTTRRFTKAIKAGANAGQPTALSALVSLYLAQVFVATEDEVATFLSPLTARSRVKEVLHALMGARQLETVAVEGKTVLHIPGTLPEFAKAVTLDEDGEAVVEAERPKKIGTGRISSFTSETKAVGEFRGKSVRAAASGKPAGRPAKFTKPAFGAKPAGKFGAKPAGKYAAKAGSKFGAAKPASKYGPRLDGQTDPERRPFKRAAAGAEKPTFTKPWDEDKKPRAPKVADSFSKYRKPEPEDRAPLGPREQAGLPEALRTKPAARAYEKKPSAKKTFDGSFAKREGSAAPKREYAAKREGGREGGFAAKKPYSARTAEGGSGFAKKPYTPRTEGSTGFAKKPYVRKSEGEGSFEKKPYAAKSPYAAKKPYAARGAEGSTGFTKRPYTPRTSEGGEGFAKRPYTPRTSEGGGDFAKRPYKARSSEGGGFAKRPYKSRTIAENLVPEGEEVQRTVPRRPFKPRAADADQRIWTKAPWTPSAEDAKPKRSFKSSGPRKSFGSKPGGRPGFKSAGRKPRPE